MNQRFIYLASASPRRRHLLQQIAVDHRVHPVEIDERRLDGETPAACVQRLALAKAATAWTELGAPTAHPVLAADTVVVLDDEVLGKPRDRDDALDMLARLSGRTHEVMTAVALIAGGEHHLRMSTSQVRFRELERDECRRYWDSGEPRDKAGAYAVQGRAAVFISHLSGSYSGVVGLPLYETASLLAEAGLRTA